MPLIPQTQTNVHALQEVRSELQSQISELSARREDLAQKRLNAQARLQTGYSKDDAALIKEYDASIAELGVRIRKLEQQKLSADDQIARALTAGATASGGGQGSGGTPAPDVVTTTTTPPIDWVTREDLLRDRYEGAMVAEGVVFVFLGIVGWRWLRRRRPVNAGPIDNAALTDMRQAIDAIAVEVERISENQRYVTKMLANPAQEIPVGQREAVPAVQNER